MKKFEQDINSVKDLKGGTVNVDKYLKDSTIEKLNKQKLLNFISERLKIFTDIDNYTEDIVSEIIETLISKHPDFYATKSPDYCPEGILQDDKGDYYIQKVCRCVDGIVRALRVRFVTDKDGNYIRAIWDKKEFSEDFPL
jgi:hypothetical protein